MALSVTAAVCPKQKLKPSLELSDADVTAQQPNSMLGQAMVCFTFPCLSTSPLYHSLTLGAAPVGCQPRSPPSPPWDMTSGSVTLGSKGAATRAVGCPFQDKKHHQSLLETVTERESKEDTAIQLCLLAVMCFLIPSPNLALSMWQPYDAIRENLS